MKLTKGEKIFGVFNYIFLAIFALLTVYPFWYVLIASISSSTSVLTGEVVFLPKKITMDSYKIVFEDEKIWVAYANTIFYTAVGTLVNMIFTICGAYPLSKKRLSGRKFFTFFIAVTMWFKAGMVPTYLNFKDLNMLNSRSAIIFGFAVTTFNVILMRTYFQSVPDALEESAKIDGANDLRILTQIYLPLSLPALMTIGLYYAVDRWNGYFWSMLLLSDENKIPLQVLLTGLIQRIQGNEQIMGAVDTHTFSKETVVYATLIVSIVPMMLLYPFIQRYFVKGIMIGSVKG